MQWKECFKRISRTLDRLDIVIEKEGGVICDKF